MDIDVKVYVKNGSKKPFIGKGPIELLKRIKTTGSINKAAIDMSMSYVKAHQRLKQMEKEMRVGLVKKQIGGRNGGGTVLSNAALELIEDYEKIERDIKKYSKNKFKSLKNKYGKRTI